eukprot:TRINITY_DN6299_c0_g1_i2.p1 TRINITY_DN6299_c0_g1~~TRINITY_DN6299_c0_g1_i2.p1  ORF type:complete len:233 (-),score=30.38 TRINITY_DN6299_c0_g1_i2:56-754(-)
MHSKKKKDTRFFKVDMGCKGSSFIKVIDPNIPVVKFLSQIFQDLDKKGNEVFQTRFTSKISPVEKTCQAKLDEVLKIAKDIIAPHFHPPTPPCKYKVEFKRRLNDKFPRDECTKALVKMIAHHNVVDLKKPEKIVLIELFKNGAGMSVITLSDFPKGLNIRTIIEGGTKQAKSSKKDENRTMGTTQSKKRALVHEDDNNTKTSEPPPKKPKVEEPANEEKTTIKQGMLLNIR